MLFASREHNPIILDVYRVYCSLNSSWGPDHAKNRVALVDIKKLIL